MLREILCKHDSTVEIFSEFSLLKEGEHFPVNVTVRAKYVCLRFSSDRLEFRLLLLSGLVVFESIKAF